MEHPWPSAASKKNFLTFGISFALYFLLILLPILLADRYCNDDLIRSLSGNYGWNNNGRHLANLLMRILQFGASRAIDISPFPQLLAIALLAVVSVLIRIRFSIQSPLLAALCAMPLGAQPFFLENLSYKFDAPLMAAAVLFSLVPFFIEKRGPAYAGLGALSLLAALNFYQPAINVFLVLVFFEVAIFLRSNVQSRPVLTLTGTRFAQALAALVVYKVVFEGTLKDWIREHGSIAPSSSILGSIVKNASDFWTFLTAGFSPRTQLLFCIISAMTLGPVILSALFTRTKTSEKSERWIAYACLLVALLASAIGFIGGPMLLLEHPIFMPRVMIGVGAAIAGGLIAAHSLWLDRWPTRKWVGVVLPCIWAVCFSLLACAYGRASVAQKNFEERVAAQISEDLHATQLSSGAQTFYVSGSAGYSPLTRRAIEQFPLLSTLILPYLRQGDFNSRNFLAHYVEGIKQIEPSEQSEPSTPDPSVRRSIYELTVHGPAIEVKLKCRGSGEAC
jgi:hypothetical protein